MSNMVEYKNILAFHPGCYVADIIEDMGISQAEFITCTMTRKVDG